MEYVRCALCDSSDYRVLYKEKKKHAGDGRFSLGVPHTCYGRIVACRRCGLVYVNPRTDREELMNQYANALDVGYSSQMELRIKTFKRQLRLIENYIPKGRLLDVGCAAGYFLYVAQKKGWQIEGVEMSRAIAKEAEQLLGTTVRLGTVEESEFPSSYFDAVSMFDVIEHLPEPAKTLREIQRILKPGGILALNFPDISSVFAQCMRAHWWFLLEDHLYYFSPGVLTQMLQVHGFKVLFFRPHWQDMSLMYLIKFLASFNAPLHRIVLGIAKTLHLEHVAIRYYAGQTTLIAQKI
ncbi:MAG: class I SAM-dependent methyltransferase [Candidatus Omnitrophota bacterium]